MEAWRQEYFKKWEERLKLMPTRQVLKVLRSINKSMSKKDLRYKDWPELFAKEIAVLQMEKDIVKKILVTREHIPNVPESRKIRQDLAKAKRGGSPRMGAR